mmetsp:Transcript_668/g.2610  ORF Transcript_668/g.2610 Transcript_668/m.2610 type:complete len:299 (-) Transcript_668:252-1148(-)
MTSSSSSYLRTCITGPKISSCAMVISSLTSANTVGSMKNPWEPKRDPPARTVAPSRLPAAMYPRTLSSCARSTCGPCGHADASSVRAAGCQPGTTGRDSAIRAAFSQNSSYFDASTKMRELAQQHCPALRNRPTCATSTALAMSACSVTMSGLFPPSSRDTRRKRGVSAHAFRTSVPTAVLPVKAILSRSSCATSIFPASSSPGSTLTTPGGKPASIMSSAILLAERGVWGAVLSTTVHPAASAGESFHAAVVCGKFQGTIAPTTPTGSFSTNAKVSDATTGPEGRTSWACSPCAFAA